MGAKFVASDLPLNPNIGVVAPFALKSGAEVPRVAFQRQCRDQFLGEGVPDVPLDLKQAVVRSVSFQDAKAIILKYEWLGRMSATRHHYGLFFGASSPDFGGVCGGVVCIGGQNCTGASYTHKMLGIEEREVGIFARGACVHWAPEHANSLLVAAAARRVKVESNYKVLLAYADPAAGEIGTIYQACNWICIGQTRPQFRMWKGEKSFDSAKIIVEAQKRGLAWKEMFAMYRDDGWEKRPTNPKHRYALILDKRCQTLRAKIDALRTPYPKRPCPATS